MGIQLKGLVSFQNKVAKAQVIVIADTEVFHPAGNVFYGECDVHGF